MFVALPVIVVVAAYLMFPDPDAIGPRLPSADPEPTVHYRGPDGVPSHPREATGFEDRRLKQYVPSADQRDQTVEDI